MVSMMLSGALLSAQHSGLMSQYMFDGLVINPAFAGSKGYPVANLNYRNQWAGFEGAPTTQTLSAHMPIKRQNISFGTMITKETIGVSRDIGFTGITSYKLKFHRSHLNIGVGAGIKTRRAGWTDVQLDQREDELFNADGRNMIRPEFSAGAFYYTKDWYAGYSIPTILGYGYKSSDAFKVKFSPLEMNHLITAGFTHEISRNMVLKPSMLFKAIPNTAAQVDLNANLILQKKFWIGASYRLAESVYGLIEYQANAQLRVGYAYDKPTLKLGQYSGGSHEVMLMYEFRANSVAKNPRYF
jgi:type IX secretion system PorP/SprF family membrane protein